jgi:hypothetical protein
MPVDRMSCYQCFLNAREAQKEKSMSTFFDALKTYEAKRGAGASSFAGLMKAVIDHEITGEEANQIRCVCASVANAFEDQRASNAQYFAEQYKKIDWWRRSGHSTDALGICPSDQARDQLLCELEIALHRATLMTCAWNADAFLEDGDGRARTESILAHYRKELRRPLNTWVQRMGAIVAGALDYDDAVDLIFACSSAAISADGAAQRSAGIGSPATVNKPWDDIATTAFQVLCGNPDHDDARNALLACGVVADQAFAGRYDPVAVERFCHIHAAH